MKSLHTKILTLLLVSVMVTAAALGGAGLVSTQKVLNRDSAQIMQLLCEDKAQEMDQVLMSIEQAVETACDYADTQMAKADNTWNDENIELFCDDVGGLLASTVQNMEYAHAVYIRVNPELASEPEGVYYVNQNGRLETIALTDITAYDADDTSHVGWYYEPIANGGATWMAPYYNANTGTEVVTYVIPLYLDDTVFGVLGMDVDLSLLKAMVKDLTVYDTGGAGLAWKNGDILYSADYPDGIKVEDFDEDLLELGEVIGDNPQEGQLYTYKWHGEGKSLIYQKLCNSMYIMISAPNREINAERNQFLMKCLIRFLLIVIAVTIAGIHLVAQITKPLTELTQGARRIAKGDWNVTIACNSDDEVGVLARTLENMIGQLKQHISRVNRLAYTDSVTGVGNMQAYNEQVTLVERHMRDRQTPYSVFLLEINNLQKIADIYGHAQSDDIVIQAVTLLKKIFDNRPIFRIRDGLFVVLLPNMDRATVKSCEKRYEKASRENGTDIEAMAGELMVSFGSATYDPGPDAVYKDENYEDVYLRAHRRLYRNRDVMIGRANMLEDSLKMLQMVFHKILKVNLTFDRFTEIKVYEEEKTRETGYSASISHWLTDFAQSGQVYEEDLGAYLAFVDIEALRNNFRSGKTYQMLRYRRKVKNEFRWVQMELVTSVEYSDDEQIVILYVRDIHDSLTAELEYHKELERISNVDSLTGLFNRYYMTNFCREYAHSCKGTRTGVVFCDLNGLKYTNDNFGHSAGDALIVSLARSMRQVFEHDMCCRMSGDEFVVCVLDKDEQDFVDQVAEFREICVNEDGMPIASIGYCWREHAESIGVMLTEAENAMYRDKKRFYTEYPRYKR